jgi:hypothetical protein
VRWDGGEDLAHTARVAEMAQYLDRLAQWADVTVVDGSGEQRFLQHQREWSHAVRHCAPAQLPGVNGKVVGAMTGVHLSRHELIVLADDDVRYDEQSLSAVAQALVTADLVRPQNVFSSWPWHARWDAARTLLNRALGSGDWPARSVCAARFCGPPAAGTPTSCSRTSSWCARSRPPVAGRRSPATSWCPDCPPTRRTSGHSACGRPTTTSPSRGVWCPRSPWCPLLSPAWCSGGVGRSAQGLAVVLLLAEGGRRGALARVVPARCPAVGSALGARAGRLLVARGRRVGARWRALPRRPGGHRRTQPARDRPAA